MNMDDIDRRQKDISSRVYGLRDEMDRRQPEIKALQYRARAALETGDVVQYRELMARHEAEMLHFIDLDTELWTLRKEHAELQLLATKYQRTRYLRALFGAVPTHSPDMEGRWTRP